MGIVLERLHCLIPDFLLREKPELFFNNNLLHMGYSVVHHYTSLVWVGQTGVGTNRNGCWMQRENLSCPEDSLGSFSNAGI